MVEKMIQATRPNWRLVQWVAGIELFFLGPLALYHPDEVFSLFLFAVFPTALIATIVFLVWLVRALISGGHRHALPILVALLILWAGPVSLDLYEREHPFVLYELGKWWTGAGRYKSEVLAQPAANSGELKHIEWDYSDELFGFTSVYLIFDPSDALSAATAHVRPGKVRGLPCEVYSVQRLESHWYSAVFFIDDDWYHCGHGGE
jgi:hypothetical protein